MPNDGEPLRLPLPDTIDATDAGAPNRIAPNHAPDLAALTRQHEAVIRDTAIDQVSTLLERVIPLLHTNPMRALRLIQTVANSQRVFLGELALDPDDDDDEDDYGDVMMDPYGGGRRRRRRKLQKAVAFGGNLGGGMEGQVGDMMASLGGIAGAATSAQQIQSLTGVVDRLCRSEDPTDQRLVASAREQLSTLMGLSRPPPTTAATPAVTPTTNSTEEESA